MTALVDASTGEVVAHCTPQEARDLTDAIKADAERLWTKLLEARDRQAWSALGYGSWREYASAEFGMSQSRAYQLLEAAEVRRALEEHASSTMVETPMPTNERQVRELTPVRDRPDLAAEAMRRAASDAAPTAKSVKDAVAEVVREELAKAADLAAQKAEDREALTKLATDMKKAGFDDNEERTQQRGAFARLCRDLAAFPAPGEFIAYQDGHLRDRHGEYAAQAHAWLSTFLDEWGNR